MRVITFSRVFPATHPRVGENTNFVQKILASQLPDGYRPLTELGYPYKYHTIRKGKRWKEGDGFSARIWTGMPYRSKQEEFCKFSVIKTWDIRIEGFFIFINEKLYSTFPESPEAKYLASNDGLEIKDFWAWINPRPQTHFEGQIICWSPKIQYP